jgi:hypothetical protein
MSEVGARRLRERQELLDSLKRKVTDLEEETAGGVYYSLASTCLNWLRKPAIKSRHDRVDEFFFGVVIPEIEKFSRVEEEKVVMMCDLLEWLARSITSPFRFSLSLLEIGDPQKVFQADLPKSLV